MTHPSTPRPRPPPRPGSAPAAWRWREREWSWLALATCVLCGVFSLWPAWDLALSRQFQTADGSFIGQQWGPVWMLYLAVPWLGRALFLAALLGWRWSARGPTCRPTCRPCARWRRRCLALALSLLLGVGLTVNGVFKEHWGRARPSEVLAQGGADRFSPALRPVAQCRTNCSFVSGHAATGFALMSVGLLGSPRTRRRWWCVGAAAGLLVGLGRIAQGGHFGSDVLFAGLLVWACHATLREAWLRLAVRRRRAARAQPQRLSVGSQVP